MVWAKCEDIIDALSDIFASVCEKYNTTIIEQVVEQKKCKNKFTSLKHISCSKNVFLLFNLNYSNGSVDVILSGFIMYDKTNLDDFIDQYDYSVGYYKGITSLQEQSDDEENYGYDYD